MPYPDPVEPHTLFTKGEILRAISKFSSLKAPGPDGIRNIVYKQCTMLLTPYFVHLFNAAMTYQTYFYPWCQFTMVILQKPWKADYSIPKAYRPIALLSTMGTLLTAVVAECLTYMLEKHQLLPHTHFGGRPGHSTTNSLHLLEVTIKNAWRSCKVVSVLFLNIEGAFSNAVTKRLIHNMRMCCIPGDIVNFTERVLMNCKTQLKFNDYTSDWIPIDNGIGQGDPLSMIVYIIYSSDLVDIAKKRHGSESLKELTLAFVDDTALVAIGHDFTSTHAILADMLECPGGAYDWSRVHNLKFETNKFALIDFSMNHQREWPDMRIQGTIIRPTPTHRFLSVMVDQELRWSAQIDNAIAKGTAYILQLRQLSSAAKGIPLRLMRQLYQSVAAPKMLYATDLWFNPAFHDGSDSLQQGSIGIAKRLSSVQHLATLAITGAMRTMPMDLLELHTNTLPMTLLLQNACHCAIVCIATHPNPHLLHGPVRRAANRYVGSHHSSLHTLTCRFAIIPRNIKSLNPACKPPQHVNIHKIHIANSKQKAIKDHTQLTDTIQIYSDGSGHKGKIGATAVLFRVGQRPRTLHYRLSSDKEHTVFEAEVVGLNLAAELLATEGDPVFPASILVNNQATIQSGETLHLHPGSYLTDLFCNRLADIKKENRDFCVTVHWIPGHADVHGNKEADKHAKLVAESRHNNSPIALLPSFLRYGSMPLSISALKAAHKAYSLLRTWMVQTSRAQKRAIDCDERVLLSKERGSSYRRGVLEDRFKGSDYRRGVLEDRSRFRLLGCKA